MSAFADSSYRRNFWAIYGYVRRRVRSSADAEDITQDVFEAAAAALKDARLDEEPSLAWLYTVAQRRLARVRSRHEAAGSMNDLEAPSYGPATASALLEAVRQLPSEQRSVVVLKVIHGLPFADIARQLGVSEEACRMRLVRGMRRLRAELLEKGLDPR
jgi:RNA polymerase sigma-70 factor, ECF subfamily